MITRGLGTSLLITRGLGNHVTDTLVDPYCQACSPYENTGPIYQTYPRLGTCLSVIFAAYDKIGIWLLQQKRTLKSTY